MKTSLIGILGGMGPYASLRAYKLLLDISKSFSSGSQNHDFPHVLIDNIPVTALIDSTVDESDTITQVRQEYMRLTQAGANIVLMACNTIHLYEERIYGNTPKDMQYILSLVEEAQKYINHIGQKKIGILGSTRTLESRLYEDGFARFGITTVIPNKEKRGVINHIIDTVISGSTLGVDDVYFLNSLVLEFEQAGCESILLGCTELPIAFEGLNSHIPFLDPLEITLRKACELYYQVQ